MSDRRPKFLAGKQKWMARDPKFLAGKELWLLDIELSLPARPGGRCRFARRELATNGRV
jgi:hypothetical protein